VLQTITKHSFTWNFLNQLFKIIGEFIGINDLQYETDKLKKIIVRFDETKKLFVKAMMVPSCKIEMQNFCTKMLYKIRYSFSKIVRLLNLHENSDVNKWLTKENARLIKKISKTNPDFANKLKQKKTNVVNIDLDKWLGANHALLCHYKKELQKWRDDIDYAVLQKKKSPEIQWRIWENYIIASLIENHSKLCIERIETKQKTSWVDRKLMEISNKITAEIMNLTRPRINSAILHKRSLLSTPSGMRSTLPINSPMVTGRKLNRLPIAMKTKSENKQASTPLMPARSKSIDLGNQYHFNMVKVAKADLSYGVKELNKPTEEEAKPSAIMFRKIKSKTQTPPTPLLKEQSTLKHIFDKKFEDKGNTTTESTPEMNSSAWSKLNTPVENKTDHKDLDVPTNPSLGILSKESTYSRNLIF
jgi:hypothetical protein